MDTSIESDILQFLRYKLRLTDDARIVTELRPRLRDPSFKPDFLISDHNRVLFVVLKRRLYFNDIGRIKLLEDLSYNKELNSILDIDHKKNIDILGLTVYYSKEIEDYVIRNKLSVFVIPPELYRAITPEHRVPIPKLSTESSIKVILALLKLRSATIQEISNTSGVSYAWTHIVISRLIQIGGINRHTGFVAVTDLDKILDSIAYERPIKALTYREVFVDWSDALDLASFISSASEEHHIHPVFTSYISASLRDRYNIRHDKAMLYLPKSEYSELVNIIPTSAQGNVGLIVLMPDRDVLTGSEIINGVRVVSGEVTILDLISGGIATREVVLRMIDHYVSQ